MTTGQQLAHVYFEDEPGGDSELLTNDAARHIAVNIAELPARIANSLFGHLPLVANQRLTRQSLAHRLTLINGG